MTNFGLIASPSVMWKPTQTATHIVKPHEPLLKPKLGKDCVCPIARQNGPKNHRTKKNTEAITYTQAGVSCFVGQESGKFKVQFFVGSSVVKVPACV